MNSSTLHTHTKTIVISGCHHKTPPIGWLKKQKLIFSQFWRWKIHSQVSSRVQLLLVFLLACGQLPTCSVLTRWRVRPSVSSSSSKSTGSIVLSDQGCNHMTSFNLYFPLQDSVSNTCAWELMLQHTNLGRIQFKPQQEHFPMRKFHISVSLEDGSL